MIQPLDFHTPVLLSQVLHILEVKPGEKYIDATIGGGGYADEILKRGGVVLGIDQDIDAIDYIKKFRIQNSEFRIGKDIFLAHGNFRDLKEIAHLKGFDEVAGIIFDLGMSSYQLEQAGRGFSFQRDEPLDMRMDTKLKKSAADLLNNLSGENLYAIFTKYAEELNSRAIVNAIIRTRTVKGEFKRTSELTQLIDEVLGRIYSEAGNKKEAILHATKARIFQALRIAVNDELANLEKGLLGALDLLKKQGRVVVLSYHSLEDRRVKLIFKKQQQLGQLRIKTGLQKADRIEIMRNSKARSAKLRFAEKL